MKSGKSGGLYLHLPVKYYFGIGIWEKKLSDLLPLLGKRVLLITGRKFAQKHGYVDKIKNIFESCNIKFFHYNKISPNPKTHEIETAGELARREKITGLLGFGGGSVMDATKAISMSAVNKDKIWSYTMRQKTPEISPLPFGLIPTTPATGSELNSSAIITNTREKRKWGILMIAFSRNFQLWTPYFQKLLI